MHSSYPKLIGFSDHNSCWASIWLHPCFLLSYSEPAESVNSPLLIEPHIMLLKLDSPRPTSPITSSIHNSGQSLSLCDDIPNRYAGRSMLMSNMIACSSSCLFLAGGALMALRWMVFSWPALLCNHCTSGFHDQYEGGVGHCKRPTSTSRR